MLSPNTLEEIPLFKDMSKRHVPWIIALLTFLLLFLLWAILSTRDFINSWEKDQTSKFTLEMPIESSPEKEKELLNYLSQKQEVSNIKQIPQSDLRKLVEPWLPDSEKIKVPCFIDVSIKDSSYIQRFKNEMVSLFPGLKIESHKDWQKNLLNLSQGITALLYVFMGLTISILLMVMIVITRSTLSTYFQVIVVLKLMGCGNRYIVNQFQNQSLKLCLMGSLMGVCLTAPLFLAGQKFSFFLSIPDFPHSSFSLNIISLCFFTVTLICFSCGLSSRLTVSRFLKKLDYC